MLRKIQNKEISQENRVSEKILSKLCLIKLDLESIERLEIQDRKIRKLVSELREKADSLNELCLKQSFINF